MKKTDIVYIFTDGACSPNPGDGGWAALLRYGKVEKLLSGGEPNTTNNRMELQAAISGLAALHRSCHVVITTDSNYVRQGILQWLPGWKKKRWRTHSGQAVKNQDLWQYLSEQIQRHTVDWQWVKAHSGHEDNERVDQAAKSAMRKHACQKDK